MLHAMKAGRHQMWGGKQDLHYKYPKPCSVGSKVLQGQDRGLTFRHPVDADDSFRMVSTLSGYLHVIWGICVIDAHSDAPWKARLACKLRTIRTPLSTSRPTTQLVETEFCFISIGSCQLLFEVSCSRYKPLNSPPHPSSICEYSLTPSVPRQDGAQVNEASRKRR